MKNYRFSLDDNIWVFRDIARNNYKSIFENDYLALLKSIHEEFGTKIQLNVYFETDGFVLSQMPDKYKSEWEENSDWLRLSFHAYDNDTHYNECTYEQMKRDCELIHNEIIRFAGEKTLSYYTTLHFVACPKEGVEAMRDCGIKGLVGLFGTYETPRVPYHLAPEISTYMQENCFWKDEETGVQFMRNDIVINRFKCEEIVPELEKHNGGKFYEVMIHEQFFHKDYPNYQPDFAEKLRITMQWLTDNGYTPAFFEEIFD